MVKYNNISIKVTSGRASFGRIIRNIDIVNKLVSDNKI